MTKNSSSATSRTPPTRTAWRTSTVWRSVVAPPAERVRPGRDARRVGSSSSSKKDKSKELRAAGSGTGVWRADRRHRPALRVRSVSEVLGRAASGTGGGASGVGGGQRRRLGGGGGGVAGGGGRAAWLGAGGVVGAGERRGGAQAAWLGRGAAWWGPRGGVLGA